MARCEIKHWDDNERLTNPVYFRGRPWRTAFRYLAFLDDTKTSRIVDFIEKQLKG